jgi:hypothetical protein
MTQARFLSRPKTAAEHRVQLATSVEVAQVALLIAALVAVAAGVVLFAGDRRLVAVTIGVWGVAAALTVHPVLGYIGWRVQQGVEADAAPSQGPDGVDRA